MRCRRRAGEAEARGGHDGLDFVGFGDARAVGNCVD